jgi:hypothetical protein
LAGEIELGNVSNLMTRLSWHRRIPFMRPLRNEHRSEKWSISAVSRKCFFATSFRQLCPRACLHSTFLRAPSREIRFSSRRDPWIGRVIDCCREGFASEVDSRRLENWRRAILSLSVEVFPGLEGISRLHQRATTNDRQISKGLPRNDFHRAAQFKLHPERAAVNTEEPRRAVWADETLV